MADIEIKLSKGPVTGEQLELIKRMSNMDGNSFLVCEDCKHFFKELQSAWKRNGHDFYPVCPKCGSTKLNKV